ncbi:MAG TPA: hypothetical protein VHP30_07385, partial [Ignavibacteriales bacterium]|nr:hypothetical protein [Ignavibacteriales bacterium]
NVFQKALDYDFSVHRSPGEITRGLGLISSINGNRLIPNTDGLTPYEMSALISQNGLLPLVIEIDEIRMKIKDLDSYIKKIVHAYSGLHLPIIFHITINADGSGAGHAIAVCGCGKSNSGTGGKDWISDNITTLYAHDDQFGPFTKIKFINGYKIETEWDRYYLKDLKNIKGLRKSYINKHTDITSIIIPTFPDFKITYETIQDSRIFELFEHFVLTKENAYKIETWDIRALFSEDYKSHLQPELKKSPSCGSRCRYTLFSLLTKSLPKYIWVISGYNSEKLLVELIIDATGLDNDLQYAGLIAYYDEITDTMKYNYEQFLVNSPRLHEKDHTFYKEYLV